VSGKWRKSKVKSEKEKRLGFFTGRLQVVKV